MNAPIPAPAVPSILVHVKWKTAAKNKSGDVAAQEDYITECMVSATNDQVHRLSNAPGIDEDYLRTLLNTCIINFARIPGKV